MDRRRFLKYAAAGAAVIGSGVAGYELDRWQTSLVSPQVTKTQTLTETTAVTQTLIQTTTETTRLASLHGRLFFDYDGNGVQEGEEPAVAGALVQLKDGAGSVIAETFTDSSGDYKLEDVKAGTYTLDLEADKKFRYMCTSRDEFKAVSDPYAVSLQGSTIFNIGLMEGFLTLPMPEGIPIDVDGSDYFDHDPGPDALWWDGTRRPAPRPHVPEYAHPETDFYMPQGTEVKAAAPGIVNGINTQPGTPWWISINHSYGYGTSYIHTERLLVHAGSVVKRGDTIGLSGNTGAGNDNYHTAFQLWRYMPDGNYYCIDPYSPVAGVTKGAWIAGIWKWYPSNDEWISQGYWTESNDPQYPS
jgi:hypothetical protein